VVSAILIVWVCLITLSISGKEHKLQSFHYVIFSTILLLCLCLIQTSPVHFFPMGWVTKFQNSCKTSHETLLLCDLIMFWDTRQDDKRFWYAQWQMLTDFNLFLTSLWMWFCLFTVPPKYVKSSTFSEDLPAVFMMIILPCIVTHEHTLSSLCGSI